jgi:Major Facilitator Superfamily
MDRERAAPQRWAALAVLSIAGLGLLLWSIIEAPVRGWSSSLVLAAGASGLAVLAGFTAWERHSTHPMLNLAFFRRRSFSAAISSVWMVTFGMYGALFVLTLYLQFSLGYTALQTGIRVLPAAAAVAVIAPLSPLLVRLIGAKLTVAGGLLIIAAGLWQISGASLSSTYADSVAGMIMLGLGAGLAIPCTTAAVMGSVPRGDTGVASATNGTFMQVGGGARGRGHRQPAGQQVHRPDDPGAGSAPPAARGGAHDPRFHRRRAGGRRAGGRHRRTAARPCRTGIVPVRHGPRPADRGGGRPGRMPDCPGGDARPAVRIGQPHAWSRATVNTRMSGTFTAKTASVARSTASVAPGAWPCLADDGCEPPDTGK